MHSPRRLLLALAVYACAGPAQAADPRADDAVRRQREAIAAMPSVEVTYGDNGSVQSLAGDTGLVLSDPENESMVVDHGAAALNVLAPVLQAAGAERLSLQDVSPGRAGQRVIHYGQSIHDIPVKGGLALAIDAEGRIVSLGSLFLPDRGLPAKARLDAAEARRVLGEALEGSQFAKAGTVEVRGAPELSYVKSQEDAQPALVWLVQASYKSPRSDENRREFWVNALTGRVEGSEPLGASFLNRSYSAGYQRPTPLGYPSGLTLSIDDAAAAARLNVAYTETAWSAFTHVPIDLGPVNVVVHYGNNDPNGYYDLVGGQHWLSFGEGQAPLYVKPLGSSLDAVAHEWGHGFFRYQTQQTIKSSKEQRAIDEAFADLSAVIVANEWGSGLGAFEIAEDISSIGTPIRSWSRPKDIEPRAVDWYPLRFIGLDPHLNVTVMGHAFYLLSQGGTHYHAGLFPIPTINVPALGVSRASEIFYWTMRDTRLQGATSFIKVRQVSELVADELDPSGASRQSVSKAWDAVGVNTGCTAPPAIPILEDLDFMCGGHHIISWASVPSATTYYAEKVPLGWPWTLAQPATDGAVNSCNQDIASPVRIRLQACNGCGCSPFGPATLLQFYQQCL
jgi:Thermolysin metallopeptidase, alpha-helical domain/Thermolysin metallopeptidase, catalytic domain